MAVEFGPINLEIGERFTLADGRAAIKFLTARYFLSNFHPAPLVMVNQWGEYEFSSSEHGYQAAKACFFNDRRSFDRIRHAHTASKAKRLGSNIRNYVMEDWKEAKEQIMADVLREKFRHNSAMRRLLVESSPAILIEANAHDLFWGVGLGLTNPAIMEPANWRGGNMLGQLLMELREILMNEPGNIPISRNFVRAYEGPDPLAERIFHANVALRPLGGDENWLSKTRNGAVVRGIMEANGYVDGAGLGREAQGRALPLECVQGCGRLGMDLWFQGRERAVQGFAYEADQEENAEAENDRSAELNNDENGEEANGQNENDEPANGPQGMVFMVCQIQTLGPVAARVDSGSNFDWPYFIGLNGNQLVKMGDRVLVHQFEWDDRFRELAILEEDASPVKRLFVNLNTGMVAVQASSDNWELTEAMPLAEAEGRIVSVKKRGKNNTGETKYLVVGGPNTQYNVRLIPDQCRFDLQFAWEEDQCLIGLVTFPAGTLFNSWFILPAGSPFSSQSIVLQENTQIIVNMRDAYR